MERLDREIWHLGGQSADLMADLSPAYIRRDGGARSDAKQRTHPGVIVAFECKHGPLSYPCDRFWTWQDNLRAIALALEHLRAVERYGVTRRGEQYTGWAQLPAPSNQTDAMNVEQAQEFISKHSGGMFPVEKESLYRAYRIAALHLHPDKSTGSKELFQKLSKAKEILEKFMSLPVEG